MLVQGVLAILLPTEDLENDCLTTLVGQIFSEMIIGGVVGGKAAEPWLLWEAITKIAEVVKEKLPQSKAKVRLERSNSDLGSRPLLDATMSASKPWVAKWNVQQTFWLVLQYAFVTFTAIRFLVNMLATASSLPSRAAGQLDIAPVSASSKDPSTLANPTIERKKPIIQMKIWSCMAHLLDLDIRMPWLWGSISMLQWGALTGFGEVGNTNGILDK